MAITYFAEDNLYERPFHSKDILSKNEVYKDKHSEKRAFVVANGPSIQKQDLSFLKEEITFTMSGIWKHPLVDKGWCPTYYCLADPLFFQKKEGFDSVLEFFKDLRKKLKNSHFFMPYFAKKSIEEYKLLDTNRVNYILFKSSLAQTKDMKIDIIDGIPGVQSVAQMGIELALYMGCNPIYLIGFDHDWLAQRGTDRHFYKGKTLKNHPDAHGDLNKFKYANDLSSCLTLWQGYEKLFSLAEKNKIEIINLTAGGFLDVFPRGNYELVVGNKN